MARPKPRKTTRHRVLTSVLSWASPVQWTVLALTLTLVCALLFVSRRHSFSDAPGLHRSSGIHHTEAASGHEVQFMQSQQNLKHSNLLEVPLKGRNKIFQGRAVPVQAGEDKESNLDLTQNGDGFLSNVAESQRVAASINATTAPAVDSKPLGFYFSKDIPGHVKEGTLGTRSSENSNRPIDGKAAMSLYFNKDKAKPSRQESDAASAAQTEKRDNQISLKQQLHQDDQETSDLGANSADVGPDPHDKMHRKVLRGISNGIQDGKTTDARASAAADNAHDGIRRPDGVEQGVNNSSGSLVIPVNSSSGQHKPLTQKTSLNTDDM